MPSSTTANLPLQNYLQGLREFDYSPWTYWGNVFGGWFSPTVNFGGNLEDVPAERYVLNEVGSYGKQLNRVIDVLTVLLGDLDRKKLTPQEQRYVFAFEDLAQAADAASANFKGKQPYGDLTHSDVNDLIYRMLTLKGSNPEVFKQLSADIRKRLDLVEAS